MSESAPSASACFSVYLFILVSIALIYVRFARRRYLARVLEDCVTLRAVGLVDSLTGKGKSPGVVMWDCGWGIMKNSAKMRVYIVIKRRKNVNVASVLF